MKKLVLGEMKMDLNQEASNKPGQDKRGSGVDRSKNRIMWMKPSIYMQQK